MASAKCAARSFSLSACRRLRVVVSSLEQHQHRDDLEMSGRSVLYGIVQHTGVEVSAHEMIEQEHEDASSIAQLAAEYETIAVEAQANRWLTVLTQAGLTGEQLGELADAESFGVLSAELRRLEASGHRVEQLLAAVVRAGRLENVEDVGSLLRHRITRLADRYQPAQPPRPGLIAGLIPRAQGAMNPDDQAGLDERETLIEQRAQAVLDRARDHQEPWLTRLPDPWSAQQRESLRVVAAYRDRWRITGPDPLGPDPDNDAQRLDYRRASAHLEILRTGAEELDVHTPAVPNTGRDAPQR